MKFAVLFFNCDGGRGYVRACENFLELLAEIPERELHGNFFYLELPEIENVHGLLALVDSLNNDDELFDFCKAACKCHFYRK